MKNNKNDDSKFPQVVRFQFEKLGTEIDVRIVVGDQKQSISANMDIQKVTALYAEFVAVFSRFESESELSKLNRSIGQFNVASRHMREIVARCLSYNKETKGLYDPRILDVLERIGYADDFKKGARESRKGADAPKVFLEKDLNEDLKLKEGDVFFGTRMDFSGIAKGYITDQVAEFLNSQGWKNFLVDSGGDMFMCGVDEHGQLWTVNVEGIDEEKLMFALKDKGIATSGIGRRRWEIEGKRMHHIINPKKPEQFLFDVKSVSVIAESTTAADVWAKTIFLMGKNDGIIYAREHSLAAVVLDYRGSAWISPKAKEYAV